MPTHVCGQCNQQFSTENAYLSHQCPSTGYTPTDARHLGPDFKFISDAALARGKERKITEAAAASAGQGGILSAITNARQSKK